MFEVLSPNGLGKGLRWRDEGASRKLCSSSSLVKGILRSRKRSDGMSLSDGRSNSWKNRLERIPILSLMVIWLNAQKSMLGPRDVQARRAHRETGNGDVNPAYINSQLLPIPNLHLFQPKRSFYVPRLAEVLSCMNFGLVIVGKSLYHLLHMLH